METTTRTNLIGIGWMVLTGLLFVAVNTIVRALGDTLPAAESAFIRFLFGIVFLLPVIVSALRSGFSPQIWGLFALRGGLHVVAVVAWFYAMSRINVAEVVAIGFLNPIVVTLGATLLLGERLSHARVIGVCVALCGAMIVLRPGVRVLETGHLSQILAAVSFGLSYLVAKKLSHHLPASVVVAMMSLTVTLGLAPLALSHWVTPSVIQVLGLAVVAVFATAGHYTMTRAFSAAKLTVTQPVIFLQLIWASLVGWLIFHETMDIWVIVGGAMIMMATCYMTWRDAHSDRG